jgi:AcrR family transcriptional regulator
VVSTRRRGKESAEPAPGRADLAVAAGVAERATPLADPPKAPEPADARAKLVAAARRLFAERGFHGTTADQLIDAAGLTRGALYRDFADKRDLFRAVFEAVEQTLAVTVAASLRPDDGPNEQRRASLRAFLRACLDPEVRRIVLLEGPVVLGWEEWRAIDAQYGFGFVTGLLESEMQAGLRPRQPIRPLAHLIMGAMNEAGLAVASARDPEAAITEFVTAVETLWGVSEPADGGSR